MAAIYNCPTCGEKMERDLLLFTRHTDGHVVEALQKLHPEWITEEGFCQVCLDHYKAAMRGETVNIAGSEIAKRWTLMGLSLSVAAILIFILLRYGMNRLWRFSLIVPLFAASLGFLQAKKKTCVILGMKGTQNLGGTELPLANGARKSTLRVKSAGILVWAIFFSVLLTGIFYVIY